jgi:hypothetical protein
MGPLTEKFEKYLARKNVIYRDLLGGDQMEDMLNEQAAILKKLAETEEECERLGSNSSVKGDH